MTVSPRSARHFICAGLSAALVIAVFSPWQPSVEITPETRKVFTFIDSLPEGSRVLMSFDFESSTFPEVQPSLEIMVQHLLQRRIRIIAMSLMPEGAGLGERRLQWVAKRQAATYGVDFIFLGFKAQQTATILGMGESFSHMFPTDYYDAPYESFPITADVKNFADVAAVISISDGSGPINWAEYGRARHGVSVLGSVTAVMMTAMDPYIASGQIVGILGGLRGAAEYEKLLNKPGAGSRGLLAQSAGHLYVAAIILIGNWMYWRSRRKKVSV